MYALKYDLKFLIFSAENEASSISKKLVEFLTGLPFNKIDEDTWLVKLKWVDKHFKYIDIDEVYTAGELLTKAAEIKRSYDYHALMIDPYNSLLRDKETMRDHTVRTKSRLCCNE